MKLDMSLEKIRSFVLSCVEGAQREREIATTLEPGELADFILDSWEGSLIRMKVSRNITHLDLFDKMIFDNFLT